MKPISINDYLNHENPWSKRLLGFAEFAKKRDIQQIENEYNLDKYAKLLDYEFETIEDCKRKEFELGGLPMDAQMVVSVGDELHKTAVATARAHYNHTIQANIDKYREGNLCELGCGYGYNLSRFKGDCYGGEYSKNAVTLAKKLGAKVSEFNYYNEADYQLIKPNTTVFTVHSIEQLPDASVIIENLEKQKSKINCVVHFEPTVVPERKSLLGMMRNKYMELNDYNRNLISVLVQNKNIEMLEIRTDLFGLMPLNSTNLIAWRFKK